MNAKTVKKLLMRRRVQALWGRRSYMALLVPYSLFRNPLPPKVDRPPEWKDSGGFEGWFYDTEDPDKATRHLEIAEVSSGTTPDPNEPGVLYDTVEVEKRNWVVDPDDDGISVRWWESREYAWVEEGEEKGWGGRQTLDAPWVRSYIARRKWVSDAYDDVGHPLLEQLRQVHNYSSAMDLFLYSDGVIVRFGVKWYHQSEKMGFCREFARALRIAKKAGVAVKAL